MLTYAEDELFLQDLQLHEAFSGVSRNKVQEIRRAIQSKFGIDIGNPILPSYVGSGVESNIRLEPYDCCIEGCMAFTGDNSQLNECRYCSSTRYDESNEPRQQFQYMPILPRFIQQFSNKWRALDLRRAPIRPHSAPPLPPPVYDDVIDGHVFHRLYAEGLFQDDRDLALRLTLDGIQLVERAKKHQHVTPVVLTICNLDARVRDRPENAMFTMIIPGTVHYTAMNTFLWPLMEELHQLHRGVEGVFDAYEDATFTLRAELLFATGDGPAIAQLMGTKRPGAAKMPCRFCDLKGVRGDSKYYYPNTTYEPGLRTTLAQEIRDFSEIVKDMRQNGINLLSRDTGISHYSCLLDVPTIMFPDSFPLDTMHCMASNIPKLLLALWNKTKFNGAKGKPWELSTDSIDFICRALQDSRATIPYALGPAPNSIVNWKNWKTHEWQAWVLIYAPIVLKYELPTEYYDNLITFRHLYRLALQKSISKQHRLDIKQLASQFVQDFERLYYNNDPEYLPVCSTQIHYLLHLHQNIHSFGPAYQWAQWSMERYLRTYKASATSMSKLHVSLMNNILTRERIIYHRLRLMQMSTIAQPTDIDLLDPTPTPLPAEALLQLERMEHDYPLDHSLQYHRCRIQNGDIIRTEGTQYRDARCSAYVAFRYWPVGTATPPLRFGTVKYLLEHPHNQSQWALIRQWSNVDPPRHGHPRRVKDLHGAWTCIDISSIECAVGLMFGRVPRGNSFTTAQFVVDKQGIADTT